MSDSLIKALERATKHRGGKKPKKKAKRKAKRRPQRKGRGGFGAADLARIAHGFALSRAAIRKRKSKAPHRKAPKRKTKRKTKRKSKLKFGSPAWRKKYLRKR